MNVRSFSLFLGLAISANAFVANSGMKAHQPTTSPFSTSFSPGSILQRTQIVKHNLSASKIEPESPFARLERKRRLASAMAFLTGWADLTLYMKYKSFATMMTGNTMWAALAAVERRYTDVGYYLSVIISYLAGLSIFRRTDLSLTKKTLPVCSFLVPALFVGSDVVFSIYQNRWLPMMMLAMGFGIINALGSEVTGTLTFVITGHMTRMTNQIVDRVSRRAGRKKLSLADKQSFIQNAFVCSGFFGGAAFAAILLGKGILVDKVGVFSAIGILYGLLFLWKDIESLGGAWWLRKDGEMCDVDDDGEICGDAMKALEGKL